MTSVYETFHVAESQANVPLQSVLRDFLPDRSWSQVKRLISQRHVQINGNLCVDELRKVSTGDVIRVSDQPLAAPVLAKDVRIVHVDEHLVVVDKPAGVTTLRHPEEREWSDRRKQSQPTLEELVDELLAGPAKQHKGERPTKKPKKTGLKHRGVRAVHRLDRDTSGLIVFARTVEAEVDLIRQFKKHSIERAYIAIAHGDIVEQTISTLLVRDRGDGLRGSTSDSKVDDAQRAITHVKPLEQLRGYTVIECRLETGRTHQIRIHLSERGHMLCGEKVYDHPLGGKQIEDTSGAQRQALHAAVLGFVHPATKQIVQFVSPLARDMLKLLERLRK